MRAGAPWRNVLRRFAGGGNAGVVAAARWQSSVPCSCWAARWRWHRPARRRRPRARLIAGASGNAVSALQAALGIQQTGRFSAATARAVRSFQRNNGLNGRRHRRPADGGRAGPGVGPGGEHAERCGGLQRLRLGRRWPGSRSASPVAIRARSPLTVAIAASTSSRARRGGRWAAAATPPPRRRPSRISARPRCWRRRALRPGRRAGADRLHSLRRKRRAPATLAPGVCSRSALPDARPHLHGAGRRPLQPRADGSPRPRLRLAAAAARRGPHAGGAAARRGPGSRWRRSLAAGARRRPPDGPAACRRPTARRPAPAAVSSPARSVPTTGLSAHPSSAHV